MIASHNRIVMIDAPDRYVYVAHGGNSCGNDHFEMLFDAAIATDGLPDHDAYMGQLEGVMPLRDYAAGLAAR